MDWLKHATVFRLPIGDNPDCAQAFIQEIDTPDMKRAWVVTSKRSRLAKDGSGWLLDPATFLKLDNVKSIPERLAELDQYRRRCYFETKEHALETYVAWRHSQGDVGYAPGSK